MLRCVADVTVDIRRFDADIIPLEGAAGLLGSQFDLPVEFESSNFNWPEHVQRPLCGSWKFGLVAGLQDRWY